MLARNNFFIAGALSLICVASCSVAREDQGGALANSASGYSVESGKVISKTNISTYEADHQNVLGVMSKWRIDFVCDYQASTQSIKAAESPIHKFEILLDESCPQKTAILNKLANGNFGPVLAPTKTPITFYVATEGEKIILRSHQGLPTKVNLGAGR